MGSSTYFSGRIREVLETLMVVEREFQQGMAAFEFKFRADVGAVMFDGAGADEKFGGNVFAGFVFGDQLQHTAFGWRQVIKSRRKRRGGARGAFQHAGGRGRALMRSLAVES